MRSEKEKITIEKENEQTKRKHLSLPIKRLIPPLSVVCCFKQPLIWQQVTNVLITRYACTCECRAYKIEQNWLKWRVSEWQCLKKIFFYIPLLILFHYRKTWKTDSFMQHEYVCLTKIIHQQLLKMSECY